MKIIYMYYGWGHTGYIKGYQRFDIITSELRKAGHEVHVIGLKRIWNNKNKKCSDILNKPMRLLILLNLDGLQ